MNPAEILNQWIFQFIQEVLFWQKSFLERMIQTVVGRTVVGAMSGKEGGLFQMTQSNSRSLFLTVKDTSDLEMT